MIARVAIDLALDRLFTYSVPEDMQKKLAVGQLLCVPFGRRMARGFAIEIAGDEAAEASGYTLKPVASIVEEAPFFSAKLLELVRRIAAYTASPLESVLRAAVPAAVLKPGAHERTQLFVSPKAATRAADLSARQRWLHEQIVRLDGGWLKSLCTELKTTPASLRALEALGLVDIAPLKRRRDPLAARRILPTKALLLNSEQAGALEAIVSATRPLLLAGITGSGKTEVYLQAIARELEAGRDAIVLVPEIALTPQTVQRFASRFGPLVAVLHSALSDGERYDEWHRIRAGEARVVVGPRSAVFAPVRRLGLVVVDEEHETSYKQDTTPRYHARDVAVLRAHLEGAKVVLGSATPSLESWRNALAGKYALAKLTRRAGAGTLPRVHVVDMSAEPRRGIFSQPLLDALHLRLDRAEQSILFLNRRGYSRSVTCEKCGEAVMCERCSLAYTYHRADSCLRCHICGGWREVPATCPACGAAALTYKGIGTQRAEAALLKCLPSARVLRMDADSTSRRHSHDDILSAFRRGEADILLGTQMIAKGLDFPNVTLVGVLNADASLNMPDFRAAERTFQLIAQVAGRAGRAELPGEVFVQTCAPDEAAIAAAARGDFEGFARGELAVREAANFPPYCRLALVNLASRDAQLVREWARMYAQALAGWARRVPGFLVSDAYPGALERADGWWRWQIVLRSATAASMAAAWQWLCEVRRPPRELRAAIDIDAFSLV